jgi:hypothetical protein
MFSRCYMYMYIWIYFKGVNLARMYSSMPDTMMTVNFLLLLFSIIVSSFEKKKKIIEKQLFNEVIEEWKGGVAR